MDTQALVSFLPYMTNYAYKFTNNRQDAEDIAQEACLKTLAVGHRVSISGLKSWLSTVVKNLCVDRKRKLTQQEAYICDFTKVVPMGLVHYYPDTDRIYEATDVGLPVPDLEFDAIDAIEQAVGNLPEEQRVTVVMFFLGWKYEEIAAFTNVAVGTVRSRLYYAKEKLRANIDRSMFYEQHDHFDTDSTIGKLYALPSVSSQAG
jgi:RNA polymerase sigma-70 factor (ECF subfamily)